MTSRNVCAPYIVHVIWLSIDFMLNFIMTEGRTRAPNALPLDPPELYTSSQINHKIVCEMLHGLWLCQFPVSDVNIVGSLKIRLFQKQTTPSGC